MQHPFDPGYATEPFPTLVENYPDTTVYPATDFRVEWGPIFHRGRLDGTARAVLIGQDPSHNENIVRRILVGEAGRRTQGFLAKLGLVRSYVMINTFLYSVYGQGGGNRHAGDKAIAAYRNQWLDALVGPQVEAVIALGSLADQAWKTWSATPKGKAYQGAYAHITHPTQPDSAAKNNPAALAAAMQAMLRNWNIALKSLRAAVAHPDQQVPLALYGADIAPQEKPEIPEEDFPPGLPDWMRNSDGWAVRAGTTAAQKRANITITVPPSALPTLPAGVVPSLRARVSPRAASLAIEVEPSAVSVSDLEDIPAAFVPEKITPPIGSRAVLTGRVVSMDANFTVLAKGAVYIQEGTIIAVQDAGQPAPQGFAGVKPLATGGTIYPGLIELHNHLSYDALRLWQVPVLYSNRDKWSKNNPEYKQLVSGPMAVLGKQAPLLPYLVRYVECKCLLSGVTTTQGIALNSNGGIRKFYHGVIRTVENPEDPQLPAAGTRIPDVTATDHAEFLAELKKRKCLLLHLSEGMDTAARNHFLALRHNGTWAITPALAGIHCVALTPEDFVTLQAGGGSMVWSPLSNLLLYGATADVRAAAAAGVQIGIGSDWSPSGSKNLLCELKVARRYSDSQGGLFSSRDIVAMATRNAAAILKWNPVGSLEAGKFADLTVVAAKSGDPYDALIAATEEDIRLVLIRGVAQYGSAPLMTALGATNSETVQVGSASFLLNLTDSDPDVPVVLLSDAKARLSDALQNLPQLATQPVPAAAIAKIGGPVWTLELDELEHTSVEMRPRLPMGSELTGTARPQKAEVPAKLKPLDLDGLTVVDDPQFLEQLKLESNLLKGLAADVAAFYGQ